MPGREIVRPSLPAALWAAVGMWAGVALAEMLVWSAFVRHTTMRPVVAVGVILVVLVVVSMATHRSSALLICGLAAGVVCGALHWAAWTSMVRSLDAQAPTRWTGEVTSDATAGAFGESSTMRVDVGGSDVVIRVGWPRGTDAPPAGSRCIVFGSYRSPRSDERGRRQFRTGQVGSVSARRVTVDGWATSLRGVVGPLRRRWTALIAHVPGDGGALLAGVVLGERTRMAGSDAESAFRTTGLTHLVAVSGGHLVVVAALASWLLTRVRTRRVYALTCVVALTGLYVVVSGVQASAVRAWLMSVVLTTSSLTGRRGDGMASLAGALWIALALSPAAAFDLGMQLSVVSVAGLLLFARLAESWVELATPRFARALASPIALTLVAQAATVPLTASTFGMVSLVSPVANLLVGPLVSLLLVGGIAGIALHSVAPMAGRFVLRLSGMVGTGAVRIAEWLAAWPHAAAPLGWSALPASVALLAVAAAVWVVWPAADRRRARLTGLLCGVAVACLAIGPPVARGPQVVVLDVGQGDAILVRDGARAILVDTGPDEAALRAALLRQGVRRLDTVLITHLHDDHYGGIGALDGVIPVERVVVPKGSVKQRADLCNEFARCGAEVAEIEAGDSITVGALTVSALWPRGTVPDAATNEASVVAAVRCGSFDALLTGDAESGVLESVLAAGGLGDVEVFKVGHHGSADAADERVLAVLRPEYALISVGTGNRFGHPVASTLSLLERSGSQVMRTDTGGDIVVRTDGNHYSVAESGPSR